jgi:hypothetical protein
VSETIAISSGDGGCGDDKESSGEEKEEGQDKSVIQVELVVGVICLFSCDGGQEGGDSSSGDSGDGDGGGGSDGGGHGNGALSIRDASLTQVAVLVFGGNTYLHFSTLLLPLFKLVFIPFIV